MMIRRHPTDAEYAAIGTVLIDKLPSLLGKDNVAEQVGLTAFALSINLLRILMSGAPLETHPEEI